MAKARLFVKSKRTTMITGHVSMETMGSVHWNTDYAEGSTLSSLSPQDAHAKQIVTRSGIEFDLVDVSKSVRARLTGKLSGIKQTPTLLVETSPSRRYVGLQEISRYLAERQNRPQD
jgi:hypothetical protein